MYDVSLDSWISAIADHHERNNLPQLPRGKYFRRTRASLHNIFGQIDVRTPAVPVSERQLTAISLLLDPNDPKHAEFWLGCLLGFQGLLRASEFCGGALTWSQLREIHNGMRITIPFSKTKLTPTSIAVGSRLDSEDIFSRSKRVALARQPKAGRTGHLALVRSLQQHAQRLLRARLRHLSWRQLAQFASRGHHRVGGCGRA